MNRVLLAALVAFAVAGGCEGSNPDPAGRPPSFNVVYDLTAEGVGDSYGTLRIRSDGGQAEVCWDLTIESLPKAIQLHQDLTGPSDPVIEGSLYEPPDRPKASGCRSLDHEIAKQVREDPDSFYIDGHNSDDDSGPILWAALTQQPR